LAVPDRSLGGKSGPVMSYRERNKKHLMSVPAMALVEFKSLSIAISPFKKVTLLLLPSTT
jgi:hypothetical protein